MNTPDALFLIILVPAGILAGFAVLWLALLPFKIDLLKRFMPQPNKIKTNINISDTIKEIDDNGKSR